MKKFITLLTISAILFVFNHSLLAQTVTVDTNQATDSTKIDTTQSQPVAVMPIKGISPTEIGDYILNLSRLLFWEKYKESFIIGVTDSRLEYFLTKYFADRTLHGLPVKVVLVNANTLPWANIIFLSKKNRDLIPKLQSAYSRTQTVIISEAPQDIAYFSFSLVMIKIPSGDLIHTYRYNPMRLKAKGVYVLPEIKAYGIR